MTRARETRSHLFSRSSACCGSGRRDVKTPKTCARTRSSRYLGCYAEPHPLTPNKPPEWSIPLRDHDHVSQERHRITAQVQSTWFPVIDRNPRKFLLASTEPLGLTSFPKHS